MSNETTRKLQILSVNGSLPVFVWKVVSVNGVLMALTWNHQVRDNPHLVVACLRSGACAIPYVLNDDGEKITHDYVSLDYKNAARSLDLVVERISEVFKNTGVERVMREFSRFPTLNDVHCYSVDHIIQ